MNVLAGTREPLEVEGHTLSISNADKVLYPENGFRKRDVLAYYRAVAPIVVPHLTDRRVQLGRWPMGVAQRGWFQANCRGAPDYVRTHVITGKKGQSLQFCVVENAASLLYVAQLGTLELHAYQAPIAAPDEPRAVVFDLDPGPGCGLADCARAARALRDRLVPLRAFAKTSGVKGIHVHVPLNGGARFAEVKAFARRIASGLAAEHPDWLTDQMPRALRANRVFIDTSQNDPGKQTVAPYSLRATAEPLVSMPVTWDELAAPTWYRPATALERIAQHGDLFADVLTLRQTL